MRALILAAGMGTRLKPVTDKIPKCMVEVNGEAIIHKQLTSLINNQINDITIVAGYKYELLENYIKSLNLDANINILNNKDYDKTNNMYSLYMAKQYVSGSSFIMMNADVFFEEAVITDLYNNPYENMIVCEPGKYIEESMKIKCTDTIKAISKSIAKTDAYGTTIDVYKFSDEASLLLFKIIEDYLFIKKDKNSWSEVAINDLIKKKAFKAMDMSYKWVEIDNHQDLETAEKLFNGM